MKPRTHTAGSSIARRLSTITWLLASVWLGHAFGCREAPPSPAPAASTDPALSAATEHPNTPAAAANPKKLTFTEFEEPGLDNVLQLSPRIFSGSQPHGEQGFESLEKLGVKTVVSVDGARPDAQRAKQHGLRYVHIPIGYDGIPRPAALALVRAIREAPGPIYIHCHHGKHRGPAAAAVACMAEGIANTEQARSAGEGRHQSRLRRTLARCPAVHHAGG